MERAVLVYTTWPSIVEAEQAGRALVERRLAAGVNILPEILSHYWWQGKIVHSYTVPAMMVLPVDSLDPRYHRWIVEQTSRGK